MKKFLIFCLAVMNLPLAQAAQISGIEEVMFGEIPTVVTASKSQESQLTAPGTVYVITDEEIHRYGWRSVQEALRSIPNLDSSWTEALQMMGLRGFDGNLNGSAILLLIDGREANVMSSGAAFVNNTWLTEKVKRIEVLMGPASTLYGSAALDGVINIVTKVGEETKKDVDTAEVKYMVGDADRAQTEGTFRMNREDFSIGMSASYYHTEGQNWNRLAKFAVNPRGYSRGDNNINNGTTAATTIGDDNARIKDPSQYSNIDNSQSMNVRGSFKDFYFGSDLNKYIMTHGLEYPWWGAKDNFGLRTTQSNFAGFKHTFSDNWTAKVEYNRTQENNGSIISKSPTVYPVVPTDTYSNLQLAALGQQFLDIRNRVNGQTDYKLGDKNSLIAGFDWWTRTRHNSGSVSGVAWPDPNFITESPTIHGIQRGMVFVQDTTQLTEKLKTTLGLQQNRETAVADRLTPRVLEPVRGHVPGLCAGCVARLEKATPHPGRRRRASRHR